MFSIPAPANGIAVPARDEYIHRLDERVRGWLESQLPNGSWADLESDLAYFVEFNATFWNRPFELAVAFASPASSFHRVPRVLAAVEDCLERGFEFSKPGHAPWHNWWAADIGAPMHLTVIGHLLRTDLQPPVLHTIVEHAYYLTHRAQHLGEGGEIGTGANATWVGINLFRLAALSSNDDLAVRAREIIATHARVNKEGFGEGLMPDGTWHQHGNGLNMGYGASHLETIAQYCHVARGTRYMVDDDVLGDVALFLDFACKSSYRGTTDIYQNGRASTRAGQVHDHVVPFLLLAASGIPQLDPVIDAFFAGRPPSREVISSHFPALPVLHARFAADEVHASNATREPLSGTWAYPYSGYVISRSADHFLSIACTDDCLKSWFSIWDENNLGYFEKEGAVFLLTPECPLNVDVQYNRPWDDRMGVTRVGTVHPVKEQYGASTITRCAVEDGTGIVGMRHVQRAGTGGTLSANKSYIARDAMLCMATTNVKFSGPGPAPGPCITSLLTVPLARVPDEKLVVESEGARAGIEALRGEGFVSRVAMHGAVGSITFSASATNGILRARIERIDIDPASINSQYVPERPVAPVDWFILRCEHGVPDGSPACQVACRFGSGVHPDGISLPRLSIDTGAHRIQVVGSDTTIDVPFAGSIFDDLLD